MSNSGTRSPPKVWLYHRYHNERKYKLLDGTSIGPLKQDQLVEVDEDNADYLLTLKRKSPPSCCGSNRQSIVYQMFERVFPKTVVRRFPPKPTIETLTLEE